MKDLKYFQNIIKEKRKNTPFRDFLKEIVSWSTVVLHRNNGIISKFPDTDRIKGVIPNKDFENSRDDLINQGIDYDYEKSFFKNFQKLLLSIDIFDFLIYGGSENTYYSDVILNSKTVYLSFTVINNCENIFYSFSVKDNCTDVFSSVSTYQNSSIVYFGSGIIESYKIFYSRFINNSNNIWFSSNLTGCSECLFCNDLDNCSFYIENIKYEKEEYFVKKANALKDKTKYLEYFKNVNKTGKNNNSTNVEGSGFYNSHDVKNGYFGYNVKTGRNLIFVGGINGNENMYDVLTGGAQQAHDLYGIMGANGDNLYCSMNVSDSTNIYYSFFVTSCSYCLGCIGLRNKSYCIFNKQYTKEEWHKEVIKIFSKIEQEGTLGDFFPGIINPFYFNDTLAGLFGNFSKQEVEKQGFMWRKEEIKVDIPEGVEVIFTHPQPLPSKEGRSSSSSSSHDKGRLGGVLSDYQGYDKDGNWQINPEILNVVIKGEKGNYYRIVKMEYDFLVKYGLPIPEIHWMDRMKLNFGM
ncbi:MAG: hypothetical protein PHS49_02340 [Candidatus Gracilibacteria bacterium]|nr:hypothetical protein [Candidatus Gracilibacteria bacterium]